MFKHLSELENESISIIRDTYRKANNPIILFSIGKDSTVLTHLFKKAFFPLKVPIKLLHIDTTWKFKEMIEFRDNYVKENNFELIVHTNQKAVSDNITPFNNKNYTDIMKTEALLAALKKGSFDFVYGGARRDEEPSRSKERVLSKRSQNQSWNPRSQNVEPWHLFNTELNEKESFRVFPLSNWTELDIWQYIKFQNIDVVPLYFSKKRDIVSRGNNMFLVDDERFVFKKGDLRETKNVRFRTLGCYPLTECIESSANTLTKIINELRKSSVSERSGRTIDYDKENSMELKKREGYF
jgi:sulfate adenylyltransferase subunit 2